MQKSENQICATQKQTLLSKTLACCSTCFKVIPAEIFEKNGKVFMLKECCSKEEVLIENDVDFYKKTHITNYNRNFLELSTGRFEGRNLEGFLRNTSMILITTTLKCNLNCPICLNTKYPSKVDHQTEVNLPLETIKKMLPKHKRKAVVLWGGEPTLREDLPEIIRAAKKNGNTVYLCTNGLKLLDREYCKRLKDAGVTSVELQFDGFRDDIYMKLRGIPLLEKKMKILKNLKELKIRTNLLAVIAKNVNEDQIPLLIKFAAMNKDFIDSILPIELYTGKIENEDKIANSDMIKIIDGALGIPSELFLQSIRLYNNIGNFILKIFGKRLSFTANSFLCTDTVYLRKTSEGFEPYFNIDWLNKTNEILEETKNKNKLSAIVQIIRNMKHFFNKDFIRMASRVIVNGGDIFKASAMINFPDIVKITPCNVKSPLNEDLQNSCYKEDVLEDPIITNTIGTAPQD